MRLPPHHPWHKRLRLRRRKDSIAEDLAKIYMENGQMPDLQTLKEPTRSWRGRAWQLSGLLLLLAAVVWGGIMLFGALSTNSEKDLLTLDLVPEETVSVGVPTHLALTYQNTGDVPIASLRFRIHPPDTFVLDRTVPERGEGEMWELGSLSKGSDGRVELFGTFFAEAPATERVQVVASYRPANFNAEFDLIKNFEVDIPESALTLEWEGAEEALAGEEIPLTYHVLNTSETAVARLRVRPIVPDSFVVEESEPPLKDGVWEISHAEAHSKTTLRLRGSFASDARAEEEVGGELSVKIAGEETLVLSKKTLPLAVSPGALMGNIIVNGSAKDQSLPAGTPLRVSLSWEHRGNRAIEDLTVSLELSGTRTVPVLWSSEETDLSEGVREGNILRFDSDALETFARVEPNEEGVIDIVLATPEELNPARFSEVIKMTMSFAGTMEKKPLRLQVTPATIRLFGPLSAIATARYFDASGKPLGSGPIPPTVEKATRYAIDWVVEKPSEDLMDVLVKTILPPHVAFVGEATASTGAVVFDESSREVRWNIATLSSGAEARFMVELTPKESDVGSVLTLTEKAIVTAQNADGIILRAEAEAPTTRLDDDPFAEDDGKVVQ